MITIAPSTLDLEIRKTGIGASEVAAVLGVSKYRDSLDVYRSKKGLTPDPDSRQMRFGRFAELFVLGEYEAETGLEVEHNTDTEQGPEEWMLATVDGYVHPPAGFPHDIADIVDAKTTSEYNRDQWGRQYSDEMPIDYFYQAQWQMLCTDSGTADFAVLFGNRDLHIARVERNDRLIQDMVERARRFWFDHVLADNPPAPTLERSVDEAFPTATKGLWLPATDEALELAAEIRWMEDLSKQYDDKLKAAKVRLKTLTGEAEGVEGVCRWSNVAGTIDYRAAAESAGLTAQQLERFRREGGRRFSILKES